jgi:hypothetical protein
MILVPESRPGQLRVLNYGGGTQSTALLILAARREIDFGTALFCNVGEDSENPNTIAYVRDIAVPYAAKHDIDLHILQRVKRDGTPETLLQRLQDSKRSITIPMRMSRTGAPASRNCTSDFKIEVVIKWLKAHGATKDDPGVSAIGISMDEIHRAKSHSKEPVQLLAYPLLERRMDRSDCVALIQDEGLPLPDKSACFYCPYKTLAQWKRMRQESPSLFWKSVEIEELLSERAVSLGQGPVTFSDRMKPLTVLTDDNFQHDLFEDYGDETCESGYCHT